MMKRIFSIVGVILFFFNALSPSVYADTLSITGEVNVLIEAETDGADFLVNASDENDSRWNSWPWDRFVENYTDDGKRMIPGQLPSAFELQTNEVTLTSLVTFPSSHFASGLQRFIVRLPVNYSNVLAARLEVHRISSPSMFNLSANPASINIVDDCMPQQVFNYALPSWSIEDVLYTQTHTINGASSNFTYDFAYLEVNCPIYTDLPYAFSLYVASSSNIVLLAGGADVGKDNVFQTIMIDHNSGDAWREFEADIFCDFMGIFGMNEGGAGLVMSNSSWVNFTIPTTTIDLWDYITFALPFTKKFGGTTEPNIEVKLSNGLGWTRTIGDETLIACPDLSRTYVGRTDFSTFYYRPNYTQYNISLDYRLSAPLGAVNVAFTGIAVFTDASTTILFSTQVGVSSVIPTWVDANIGSLGISLYSAGESGAPYGQPTKTIDSYRMIVNKLSGPQLDIQTYDYPAGVWTGGKRCSLKNITTDIGYFRIVYRAEASATAYAFWSGQYNHGTSVDKFYVSIHVKDDNNTIWLYDYLNSNIRFGQDPTNYKCVYENSSAVGAVRKTFWFRPYAILHETNGQWVNDYVPPIITYNYIYITRYVNLTVEEACLLEGIIFDLGGGFDVVDWAIGGVAWLAGGAIWVGEQLWNLVKDTPVGDFMRAAWDVLSGIGSAIINFFSWVWDGLCGIASFLWNSGVRLYEFIRDAIPAIISAMMILSRLAFILVTFAAVWMVRTGFIKLAAFFNILSTRGLTAALKYGASISPFSFGGVSGGFREFGAKVMKFGGK